MHADGVQSPLTHALIMEQKGKDAALKGMLASAILGRLDEGQHQWNWLLQLCKKALEGEMERLIRQKREVREELPDESHR